MQLSDLMFVVGGWGFGGEAGVSPCKWEAGELVWRNRESRLDVPELRQIHGGLYLTSAWLGMPFRIIAF